MSAQNYTVNHIVSGQPFKGNGDRFGPIFSPETGDQIGQVHLASEDDTLHAIEKAHAAFDDWSVTSPVVRARIIFKYRELLIQHTEEMAQIISRENGKTVGDAKGELSRAIELLEHAVGIPTHLRGENTDLGASGLEIRSYRFPLGVVASISPFNFPVMTAVWLFAMAIACGNTVILKPSEKVPSSTNRLVELFNEAGLPDGVLNVINGDKTAVDVLLRDERVKAVGFIGSTPIAKYIYTTGTAHGKRVQAFGGAKNHAIIMPDSDIDFVADTLTGAAYGAAGARCMAVTVAVPVGKETADNLVEAMAPRVRNLNVSPSSAEGDFGPVITAEHRDRIATFVESGVQEGASLIVDGRDPEIKQQGYENGFYMGGSLFDNVTTDMKIYREEIFGPVLSVTRTGSYEEAINRLNGHQYGNGASIFTQNGKVAQHFIKNAQAGSVGVNVPIPVPLSFYTFGGWKDSSFRSHNVNGQDVVMFYTQTKTATVRFPNNDSAGPAFSMPTFDS